MSYNVIIIRLLYLIEAAAYVYRAETYSFVCLFCVIVTPISCGTPRMSRSNSTGPSSDSACDLYGSSPLGSSMSLTDRPKSLMRSGSFREQGDDGEHLLLSSLQSESLNMTLNETKLSACTCNLLGKVSERHVCISALGLLFRFS